jgi:hypothetical protein
VSSGQSSESQDKQMYFREKYKRQKLIFHIFSRPANSYINLFLQTK